MTIDVVVVGGGISGLATACELARRGHKTVVLERQVRIGGNATSERIGGFLMEHGPSSVNGLSTVANDWSSRLGLETQRLELGPEVRRRYLVRRGVPCGISTQPLGLLTAPYLSVSARLRLLAEPLVPRRRVATDETVAAFFSRRFGSEFAERVVDPLIGGLFAGASDAVSMSALFPALVQMEQHEGSVVRGVARRVRGRGRMPARRLFSWRNGVGALPAAFADRLGPAIRTGVTVRAIHRGRDGFQVETSAEGTLLARSVVIATQPHVSAQLLANLDPEAAEAAAAIDAPPIAVVFLGYRREQVAHPLDGIGFLIPSCEGREISGALFCSTMFEARAPQGHVAFSCYVGGARNPTAALTPASELTNVATAELADLVGARGEPVLARVRSWPRGLPQYELGHHGRVARLRNVERHAPGLFLTGNYFRGPAVAACLEEAREVSERAHEFLGATREASHLLHVAQAN